VLLKRLNLSVAPILPVIVINVVFTFVVSNISVAGHLGGLVTGAIATVALVYAPHDRRTVVQAGAIIGLAVLLLAVVALRMAALG
jgi:membrane associated rhomboid family serine protease